MKDNASNIECRMEEFMTVCRANGVKITPQRMEVFREVARTDAHPDVESIFSDVRKRMPAISMDTVYRTLCSLEKLGLIQKVSELHGATRYDGNVDHHHHFVCTTCGCVHDFYSEDLDRYKLPAAVQTLGTIKTVRAEVVGVCRQCLTRQRKK